MSEKSIYQVQYDVIKDAAGVYPAGCPRYISCDALKMHEERIAVDMTDGECGIEALPGDVLPLAGSATPNVLTYKLDVPGEGFVWVEKASYDTNNVECNGCCIP